MRTEGRRWRVLDTYFLYGRHMAQTFKHLLMMFTGDGHDCYRASNVLQTGCGQVIRYGRLDSVDRMGKFCLTDR